MFDDKGRNLFFFSGSALTLLILGKSYFVALFLTLSTFFFFYYSGESESELDFDLDLTLRFSVGV